MDDVMKDPQGYLTKEQVDEICEKGALGERNRMMIKFLFQTGARIGEALAVLVGEIDLKRKHVLIHTSKKRKRKDGTTPRPIRKIPLTDRFSVEISTYIKRHSLYRNDRIFKFTRQTAHRIFRMACYRTGYTLIGDSKPHCHLLRHSFAIHWVTHAQGGTPAALAKLQYYMGHEDFKTTAWYWRLFAEDGNDTAFRGIME